MGRATYLQPYLNNNLFKFNQTNLKDIKYLLIKNVKYYTFRLRIKLNTSIVVCQTQISPQNKKQQSNSVPKIQNHN